MVLIRMVKLFIDSAKLYEIKEVKRYGLLDGVTTNPSLIKEAVDVSSELKESDKINLLEKYIKQILKICGKRPVSLEVIGINFDDMVNEGNVLNKKFGKFGNVYVKIPIDPCMEDMCNKNADGIMAIKSLKKKGIKINCTLIFTPEQALLAAKSGADIVSPFMGREDDYIREINRIKFDKKTYFPKDGFKKGRKVLEDNGIVSGVDLIKECVEILKKYKQTEVLAASIRNVRQFREAAIVGADIATLPFNVIQRLLVHPKTKEGMKKFTGDVVKEYRDILRS
jgi:transaldolase